MKRALDFLADRGCWISHDRVYALVSADRGVCEIGYHGLQPVSRNSRMLVNDSGVLRFSLLTAGTEASLQTNVIEWEPSQVVAETAVPGGICGVLIQASGRTLIVRCDWSGPQSCFFRVHVAKSSFFTNVHGERTWSEPEIRGDTLVVRCRDVIMLQKWLRRTGPYAGDFLIPEHIRRKIFAGAGRSGTASCDDLRAEFREADFALYDAEVFLRCGGEGFHLLDAGDEWVLESPASGKRCFTVEFFDQDPVVTVAAACNSRPKEESMATRRKLSRLILPGFPRLEEFASSAPGLVNSCVIRDFGIPRACPGRYYWIWAWDALVTMVEALRWGDRSGAAETVRFINRHRDADGRIPARWTRSLEPLDTPSPGGIEFLQAALTYETYLETGDGALLTALWESVLPIFERVEGSMLERGIVTGEGFYPDLLTAFGRSEESVVCMEAGSWYVLCRILENISRHQEDHGRERRARLAAEAIGRNFGAHFWDEQTGFFRDSWNVKTGLENPFHPLFSLLFLQSPIGLGLAMPYVRRAGAFIARELMTDAGLRVLPLPESLRGGEAVVDSWYPHWDLYALKLLRRSGNAEALLRWMRKAEGALDALGYCPEYLGMKKFRDHAPDAWSDHGSASNLNGVTSWHRALRESVAGFEIDPGGITHVPLALPIRSVAAEGVSFRGGDWTLECTYGGPFLEMLTVDGVNVEGCLKVPAYAYTAGEHRVTAQYGDRSHLPIFTEILNATVLRSQRSGSSVEVEVIPHGHIDVAFLCREAPRVLVCNREIAVQWDKETGAGYFACDPDEKTTMTLYASGTSE